MIHNARTQHTLCIICQLVCNTESSSANLSAWSVSTAFVSRFRISKTERLTVTWLTTIYFSSTQFLFHFWKNFTEGMESSNKNFKNFLSVQLMSLPIIAHIEERRQYFERTVISQ